MEGNLIRTIPLENDVEEVDDGRSVDSLGVVRRRPRRRENAKVTPSVMQRRRTTAPISLAFPILAAAVAAAAAAAAWSTTRTTTRRTIGQYPPLVGAFSPPFNRATRHESFQYRRRKEVFQILGEHRHHSNYGMSHVPTGARESSSSSLSSLSSSSSNAEEEEKTLDDNSVDQSAFIMKTARTTTNRRDSLKVIASTLTFLPALASASAISTDSKQVLVENEDCGLEGLSLGEGRWIPKVTRDEDAGKTTKTNMGGSGGGTAPKISTTPPPLSKSAVPATFATYACRFLINYDEGVRNWWFDDITASYALLSPDQRQAKLGRTFGNLARSLQEAVESFVAGAATSTSNQLQQQKNYEKLATLFVNKYGQVDNDAKRHIGLLFATLPAEYQPSQFFGKLARKTMDASESTAPPPPLDENDSDGTNEPEIDISTFEIPNPPPPILREDLSALLPPEFDVVRVKGSNVHAIYPPITLYEVGLDEEFGQTAVATATGPLAATPLGREQPTWGIDVYALLGISGGVGCALTHTVVIPLDVVKTRVQTEGVGGGMPDDASTRGGSLIESARSIVEREGPSGLLLGAQATIAGYLWYGVSVYPSYALFKRWLGLHVLSPEVAMVHVNDVALVAGALAAVVASLGLTPLEAARIRAVAEPDVYRPKGMLGTLSAIAAEDETGGPGWNTLYAGLPSLLTRQVIFGSVKFLAFERASELIFAAWPVLHDADWTSNVVSLIAGGFSGALSSVVSQPADSVLTYVAQQSNGSGTTSGGGGMGVIEGSRIMMEKEGGVASLFRGLGSRCVWAGSIIAGQFYLYDVFRTTFGVSGDDLSQVYQVTIGSQ